MDPVLIEVKQDRPGFDRFIGSWVCKGDTNIVIDVGPANSVNRLAGSLKAMDMERIDLVLLTHIHIDHVGGLADFLDHFPMANAICHDKGIKHLIDPSKLWAGSRNVLGEVAEVYGAVKSVKRERLIPHTEVDIKGFENIETPGHAPHHLSFGCRGNLFVGEAGGNYFTIRDSEYLRPATPPLFFLNECLKTIDRLLAMDDQPICYAHFGRAESSHGMLNRSRDQLMRWEGIIKKEMSMGEGDLMERCMGALLEKDPELRAFQTMAPDVRERERFFMGNSIKGYVGFLKNKPG